MKGIVFTEFFELVEDKFGYKMVDQVIESSNLPNNGSYTAVGTYPFNELATMLQNLSKHSGVSANDLLVAFGHHLFNTFYQGYSHFFAGIDNAFQFLSGIENYIHTEVRKLYPDAELPTIDTEKRGDKIMLLHYKSTRRLSKLAYGLIEKTLEHYKHKATITEKQMDKNGEHVLFTIELQD
ncbi:MAG: heme NO-binding domain-containing protein [Bacteroidia bacterium]